MGAGVCVGTGADVTGIVLDDEIDSVIDEDVIAEEEEGDIAVVVDDVWEGVAVVVEVVKGIDIVGVEAGGVNPP